MKTLASFFGFLLLCTIISHAQDTEYSFREKYTVAIPAQLNVSSFDGDIEVIPSNTAEIQVFYIVKKNNRLLEISRKELERDLIIDVAADKNTLRIKVEPRDKNTFWMSNWNNRINVNFKIYTPAKTACRLNTSDGNVTVSGLTGNQEIKTSDGDVRIDEITGEISAGTSDGNVTIASIKGSVNLRTSDGDIRLEKISGDVDAGTSDGNIDLTDISGKALVKTSDGDISFREISGSLTAVTSDGGVRGNMVQLKGELTVRTSDGNINVTIPDKLGLDLDIRGEDLDIPLENFTGKSDEKTIRGKCNGGGIAVNLVTSSGRVTLTQR